MEIIGNYDSSVKCICWVKKYCGVEKNIPKTLGGGYMATFLVYHI
jgi:hypothetical protein